VAAAAVVDDATSPAVKLQHQKRDTAQEAQEAQEFLCAFLGGHCCLLGCNIKTAAAGVLCVSAWPKKRGGKEREKSHCLMAEMLLSLAPTPSGPSPITKNITTKKRCIKVGSRREDFILFDFSFFFFSSCINSFPSEV
jgi:hypothetical protein